MAARGACREVPCPINPWNGAFENLVTGEFQMTRGRRLLRRIYSKTPELPEKRRLLVSDYLLRSSFQTRRTRLCHTKSRVIFSTPQVSGLGSAWGATCLTSTPYGVAGFRGRKPMMS